MSNEPRIRKDLVALYDDTFPKICEKCGKVYPNKRAIDEAFAGKKRNALIEYDYPVQEDNDPKNVVVANYVTCTCGSTLFILFKDRRDQSEAGKQRRLIFERLRSEFMGMGFTEGNSQFIVRSLFREMVEEGASLEHILDRAAELLKDFRKMS